MRTPAGGSAVGARRPVGRRGRGIARALGANADALPPRAVARLSGGLVAEQRTDTARRRGRVPDRGYQTRPGQRGSADGDRGHGTQRRCGHPVLPCRSGRPLALFAGVHSRVGQHRSATHAAVEGSIGGLMILDLGDEAKEYGREALRAFETAGGDQLLQQAEAKPDTREALVAPILDGLGAWELDARTAPDSLEAAAALCRSAGYWALPYPVAERLSRPTDLDVDGLIVVADGSPETIISGVQRRWTAVTLGGHRSSVVGQST